VLTGHDGPVMSVAVTADGAAAVSGSYDSTVRVWDLATWIELASWIADSTVVSCAAIPARPSNRRRSAIWSALPA